MDEETPATEIESTHQPIFTLPAKPRVVEKSDGPCLIYGLANNTIAMLDMEKQKLVYEGSEIHSHKIGCLRLKENILMTGGFDNTVKIFDPRTFDLIHTFQKIPGRFNSIDKAQHIIAAANNSNIVFWDLRKMKQRSEFTQSFNGQITHIRFEDEVPTNLMGCSIDGMMNMFDLTQPNEEDSLSWCFKIMESPQRFSIGRNGMALVQTVDHVLHKIEDGNTFGKIMPNNPDFPKHIVTSNLSLDHNAALYDYATWSPEEGVLELWMGDFHDRNNHQKCLGYINGVPDIELFTLLRDRRAAFADENGNIFSSVFGEEKRVMRNVDKKIEITQPQIWKFTNSLKKGKEVDEFGPITNKNGYVIQKQNSSLSKKNKFRPF